MQLQCEVWTITREYVCNSHFSTQDFSQISFIDLKFSSHCRLSCFRYFITLNVRKVNVFQFAL
nr:hypothetical protein Iba_chr02aCG12940 [Ipomoea batatas]GMC62925.1 hypothetical protein Iba_chr02cCG8450 [Ipomoea batatas]GMC64737.1 hypothetical protein Iba_chr02dCG7700 [Ipomoea batatas]GMC66933.1 hypothetical protein Iba_chr02eCG10260 [Ipomoea batatas]